MDYDNGFNRSSRSRRTGPGLVRAGRVDPRHQSIRGERAAGEKDLHGGCSMRRGPKISQGLELAIPFALRRGHVMVFMATLLNLAEFLITGNGLFVLVRVRLARRIRVGIPDIESEFADAIAGLRLVPRSGPVSCELWLYSKHGTLRHFRVEDTRLVEIDCCGTPLDQLRAVTGPAQMTDLAGTLPGPAPAGTAGTVAAGVDLKSPIVRWLKKWNAVRSAKNQTDADDSSGLRKILESVRPGGSAKQGAKKNSGKKPSRKNATAAGPEEPEKSTEPGIPIAGTGEMVTDQSPASVTEPGTVHDGLSSDRESGVPAETGVHPSPVREKSGEEI